MGSDGRGQGENRREPGVDSQAAAKSAGRRRGQIERGGDRWEGAGTGMRRWGQSLTGGSGVGWEG